MSEYVKVDSGEDILGKRWEVGVRDGCMEVAIGSAGATLHFDDEDGGRSRFAEAVARAVMPRVKHGSDCGCTPCKAAYETCEGGC